MLPEPNTPPITPPGISVSAANSNPLSASNRLMQAEVWPGVYMTVSLKSPRSIRLPSLEPEVDVDRLVRLVEHLAQHREVVAQHGLVGGEPMRRDDGALL